MAQHQGELKTFKALPILAAVFRLIAAIYIVVLSVLTLIYALLNLSESVGVIIASVHILPASLFLLALEFEVFRQYATLEVPTLNDTMYPARTIALQFLAAVLTGINQRHFTFFIMGCVAFGITVSLVHLSGIHGLFWEIGTSFRNGGMRSQVSEKTPLQSAQDQAVGSVSASVKVAEDEHND
ncbi:hypothetical protein FRC12_007959 [Ceratobasidium sp. 428]|nr:hypothetical protein FRC12_007959 [Ceratobasidium sp. 428]